MTEIKDEQIEANPELISQDSSLFNNFFWKLPGGRKRLDCGIELPPRWWKSMGFSDVGMFAYLVDKTYADAWHNGNVTEAMKDGLSNFYVSKTPRQFFNDVDNAIIETRGSLDEIRRINFENFKTGKGGLEEITRIHHKKLVPIYLFLREMGYSHYDLRA